MYVFGTEPHPNLESMKEGLELDKRHVSMALCKEPGPLAMAISVHKNCDDVTKDPVGNTLIAVFDGKALCGFDSHVARSWRICGTGIQAATQFVELLHLHLVEQGRVNSYGSGACGCQLQNSNGGPRCSNRKPHPWRGRLNIFTCFLDHCTIHQRILDEQIGSHGRCCWTFSSTCNIACSM